MSKVYHFCCRLNTACACDSLLSVFLLGFLCWEMYNKTSHSSLHVSLVSAIVQEATEQRRDGGIEKNKKLMLCMSCSLNVSGLWLSGPNANVCCYIMNEHFTPGIKISSWPPFLHHHLISGNRTSSARQLHRQRPFWWFTRGRGLPLMFSIQEHAVTPETEQIFLQCSIVVDCWSQMTKEVRQGNDRKFAKRYIILQCKIFK